MTEIAEVRSLCEVIIREISAMKRMYSAKRKPLTITAFAEEVGLSRWTIQKRIKEGSIRTVDGRIPASELDKFLS